MTENTIDLGDRKDLVAQVEAELVAEINRQVIAHHGTGETASATALEFFGLLDMTELADTAIKATMHQFSQDLVTALGQVRAGMTEAFGEKAAEAFEGIDRAAAQIKAEHDAPK